MALQPESLRKLRDLMRQADNKAALATWVELLKLVQGQGAAEAGNGRPVQIQLNNYIARPGKGTPATIDAKVVS